MKLRLVLAPILTALLVTLTGGPSHADVFGWRWDTRTQPIRVYDATGDARWGVALAAQQWSAAAPIVVSATPCTGCITVTVSSTLPYAGLAQWTVTNGVATNCSVTLSKYHAAYPWAHHIALHEMGHCFGLAHSSRPKSVMYPTVSSSSYLTKPSGWDLSELRGLYR